MNCPAALLPIALAGLLLMPGARAAAQSAGTVSTQQSTALQSVQGLDAANGAAFLSPLTQALVRGLFTGFGDRPRPAPVLSLRVGVRSTGAWPGSERATFAPILPSEVTFRGAVYTDPWVLVGGGSETPTATGSGGGVVLRPRPGSAFEDALRADGRNPEEVRVVFPAGLDLDLVPLTVVEGDLGIGGGTNLAFRLTPTVNLFGEIGDASALGVGLSHEVARYFLGPEAPVQVSLGVSMQRLRVGGWAEADASTWSVAGGAGLGVVQLRGVAALSKAEVDVRYRARQQEELPAFPGDGDPVDFSVDMERTVRLGGGATLTLGRFELAGDYVFTGKGSASVAAFFRLR